MTESLVKRFNPWVPHGYANASIRQQTYRAVTQQVNRSVLRCWSRMQVLRPSLHVVREIRETMQAGWR